MRVEHFDLDREDQIRDARARLQLIRCLRCGEESGALGTSLYGQCHKWGPTTHCFQPDREPAQCEITPMESADRLV